MSPELLTRDGTSVANEPLRLIHLASCLAFAPLSTLLLFNAVFLVRGKIVLAILHRALIRTQARIRRR
jgi:hypothetical protein